MARAHFVRKARKDNPAAKQGEPYWWWQLKGRKQYSKACPTPSQLTGSEYALEEDLEAVKEARIEEIREGLEEKISNLEEASPSGSPTTELLEERRDRMEDLGRPARRAGEFGGGAGGC
jgi:hypothetical protein